ncbi:DUF1893 domain-containing protein [Fusobacterium sp. PH5-44]|uniref:DUF1893 domain-containing protein n=1 Tax=unclassified Fusobacterium TaxID=2648384 RepID=UPI003D1C4DA3
MKKLKKAIEILENEDVSFVSIIDEDVIKDKAIGIKPIFQRIKSNKNFFKDAVVADKIIGKAAAMLLIHSGVSKVYGKIMSIEAVKIFDKHNVYYEFGEKVDFIHNRDNTGLCPMEETVKHIESPSEVFLPLSKTIDRLMSQNK